MSIHPQDYLYTLGHRLETINDLRAYTGQPLMTRGELLRRDLQQGLTPPDIRAHCEQELGKEHIPSLGVPSIEEEEPDLRDLLRWIMARSSEPFILKRIAKTLNWTDADWDIIQKYHLEGM